MKCKITWPYWAVPMSKRLHLIIFVNYEKIFTDNRISGHLVYTFSNWDCVLGFGGCFYNGRNNTYSHEWYFSKWIPSHVVYVLKAFNLSYIARYFCRFHMVSTSCNPSILESCYKYLFWFVAATDCQKNATKEFNLVQKIQTIKNISHWDNSN